jgi:hypothetical protein
MDYDSDSYSSHFFITIMKNHDKLREQFECLRENRPTNNTTNPLFFLEAEEKPLEPFSDFEIKKEPSDDSNFDNLFNLSQNSPSNKNENPKPIVNTPNKTKELEDKKEINGAIQKLLLFTTFQKCLLGRTSNELKENPKYKHSPKHSGIALDNFTIKVIRKCIFSISRLIESICLSLGYKIDSLNNTFDISSKELKLYLCDNTMLLLFINNFAKRNSKCKDLEKKYKNKGIYHKLVANGKLAQSPLLMRIFEMTFGQILFKFINDDNFAKKIDPNFSFTTFSDLFNTKEYPEALIESSQESLRKLLGQYNN